MPISMCLRSQSNKGQSFWRGDEFLKQTNNISRTSAWRILWKSLTLFPYRIQVAHKLTLWLRGWPWPMPSIKQLERHPWVAHFSMGQWRKSFLSEWCCEQSKLWFLGYWKAIWSTTETTSLCKGNCVGYHEQQGPDWPILLWEQRREDTDIQYKKEHWKVWDVQADPKTEEICTERSMVDAKWRDLHSLGESLKWLGGYFQERVMSLKTDFEWLPHSRDLKLLIFIFRAI